MFKIQVRSKKGDISEFSLDQDSVLFGRSPDVDILLPSSQSSRHHARLYVEKGIVMLEDLDSSNGTYVRNEQVGFAVEVEAGTPLRMGDTFVRFDYTPPDKKSSSKSSGDSGYSMAERLGNKLNTVKIDASDLRKEFHAADTQRSKKIDDK